MEIEPERIPRPNEDFEQRRGIRWTLKPAGPLPVLIFGLVAMSVAVLFLFFMFWAAILFAAVGVLALAINRLRALFGAPKPRTPGQGRVFLSIERDPDFLKRTSNDDDP